MERFLENSMYASRWLLAPIYFGLSIALLLLGVKFFQEASGSSFAEILDRYSSAWLRLHWYKSVIYKTCFLLGDLK